MFKPGKKIVLLLVALIVLGGAGFGLWQSGMLPLGGAAELAILTSGTGVGAGVGEDANGKPSSWNNKKATAPTVARPNMIPSMISSLPRCILNSPFRQIRRKGR